MILVIPFPGSKRADGQQRHAFDLHVSAGRWVVLSFLGSPNNPRAITEITELVRACAGFDENHIVVACVFTGRPDDVATFATISSNKLFFLADDDGSISREFGAAEMPRTIVLDPMLRSIADIAWDNPQGHAETVGNVLRSLPPVDDAAGVPLFAPALIVPRVFSFELCDFLVQFYEGQGGTDSGFQFDISGKTTTISDWRLKRRSDVPVAAAEVRELVRGRIVRRLHRRSSRIFNSRRRGWIATSSSLATTPKSAATFIAIATTSTLARNIAVLPCRSTSTTILRAAT